MRARVCECVPITYTRVRVCVCECIAYTRVLGYVSGKAQWEDIGLFITLVPKVL